MPVPFVSRFHPFTGVRRRLILRCSDLLYRTKRADNECLAIGSRENHSFEENIPFVEDTPIVPVLKRGNIPLTVVQGAVVPEEVGF